MDLEVCFYGNLVRLAGGRTRIIRVPGETPRVSDLREAIRRQVPEVAAHLHHTAIGAGTDLLDDDDLLSAGATIALLPPVSGG